ncbi:PE-PGRS family protein [Actinacidiphila acididurans]|uniref:PE-PGRS family protein n=1 Tax=Actinacidiphila acididurans TaxID=2784346 RepID=A0ABS2TS86_9ACTN|nr:PE-PGRS family protein [Actinacidiphila acididurans]MBM9506199.1 PE-PGRS family protein [Actinacidiphila acididurans]
MEIGEVWAFRPDPGTAGGPVHRVRIVRIGGVLRSGQARIAFLDGPQELEWADQRGLVAPWDQAGAFLDDERRTAEVAAASRSVRGSVEFEAARLVLSAARPRGRVRMRGRIADAGVLEIRNLDPTCSWLAISAHQLRREPLAFEDRHGRYLAPWPVTLQVARRVARVCREDVLREAHRREPGLRTEQPAPPWRRSRADSAQAFRQSVLAVVREWCA